MQSPLYKSLAEYRDKPEPGAQQAFNQVWNTVQKDVSIEHCIFIFMERTVFCPSCGVAGCAARGTGPPTSPPRAGTQRGPTSRYSAVLVYISTNYLNQGGCCAWEKTTDSGAAATKDSASLVIKTVF